MPAYQIEGQVYLADGFDYRIVAPNEVAARILAERRVHATAWPDAAINEVCIQSATEIAPGPPPSPLLTGVAVAAPELNAHDVSVIAILLDLELTAQRAAGNPIDAAYLRLHAEFCEMAQEIINAGKETKHT